MLDLSNIYFVYLHTVEESDSTERRVNIQHGCPATSQDDSSLSTKSTKYINRNTLTAGR